MAFRIIKREAPSVRFEGLTEKQSNFIREYIERGGKRGSAADAAQAAGYAKDDRPAAFVRAAELLRNPKILSVLRDELAKKLSAAAALGVNVLVDLAENGPPQVRLQAAKELVDRGYGPVMSRAAHIHMQSPKTIEDFLDMVDDDGADAAEPQGAIDADWSEVEASEPAEDFE